MEIKKGSSMDSSKVGYKVPVYMMLAEDINIGQFDYYLLDKIIVVKTKKGYEEIKNGFSDFFLLTSIDNEKIKKPNSYSKHLYLNEDDIIPKNIIDINNIDNYDPKRFSSFIEEKHEKVYTKFNGR